MDLPRSSVAQNLKPSTRLAHKRVNDAQAHPQCHSRSNSVQLPLLQPSKLLEQLNPPPPQPPLLQERAPAGARACQSCPQAPLSPTTVKTLHSNGAGLPAFVRAYGMPPSLSTWAGHSQRVPAAGPPGSPSPRASSDLGSLGTSPFARVSLEGGPMGASQQLVLLFLGSPCMPSLEAMQVRGRAARAAAQRW